MKLRYAVVTLGLLWASAGSLAYADDTSPVTAPTQQVVQPTIPPVVDQPTQPPIDQPTAVTEAPVGVAQEHTTPIVRVSEPSLAPTASESTGPSQYDTGANSVPPGAMNGHGNGNTLPGSTGSSGSPGSSGNQTGPASPSGASTGVTLPPLDTSAGSTGDPSLNFTYDPKSAQAPGELTCSGKDRTGPVSPFLVSPYAGWTEMISFLDHDSPDYSVDGSIVIANGLRADATDGQESDMFPAYWSSDLRQYVNYDGHNGYDFTISYQPVLAAGSGTVSFAGWTDSGYGNMVLINHHNGYTTLYGHLSQLHVKKGDRVSAGEQIGISGSTGRSSGPHLHFSVFHNCQVTDPYGWTGKGQDPLFSFDREHAQYLWLPGHDPLIVNPPPQWPAYPAGLKVDSLHLTSLGAANRILPAANRLLLLQLPSSPRGSSVQPAVALARTESLMTQEAESLAPALQQLKQAGYVDAYEVIPAAAAIWVRGTASAAQLEALPGVASLAGVRPADLQAAQTGLAHSVLVQMGQQPAPSLWPAGFRSALQTWRPVTTTVIGQALVAGAALPGQKVTLTLNRGRKVAATAEAYGDADNGGFAATLHDPNGQPIAVQPGDSVNLVSGTRVAHVTVADLQVRTRARDIFGQAARSATVPVVVADPHGMVLWQTVAEAASTGAFTVRVPFTLSPGCQAVVSSADAAGNQQASAGYMPGLTVDLSSSQASGWAVGNGPYLEMKRHGRLLESRPLHATPDGTFALDLRTRRVPAGLKPGDIVSVGSRWHRRSMPVPDLRVVLTQGSKTALIHGPARTEVQLTVNRPEAVTWTALVRLDPTGLGRVTMPRRATDGVTASAVARLPNDLAVSATAALTSLQVFLGDGALRGVAPPNTTVSLSAVSSSGRVVGSTVAASDGQTGIIDAHLNDVFGRVAHLSTAKYLTVEDGAGSARMAIPAMKVSLAPTGAFSASLAPKTLAQLDIVYAHRTVRWNRTVGASGTLSLHVPNSQNLRKVLLSVPVSPELSVVRTASLLHRSSSARAKRSRRAR